MRLCVFEDDGVERLEPLALTRPACDLWCGTGPLLERQRRHFGADEVGLVVRPALAEWCRFLHPREPVNDAHWLRGDELVLVNARWLPPLDPSPQAPGEACVGMVGGQVAYLVIPGLDGPDPSLRALAAQVRDWRQSLPQAEAGGFMIDYLWDLLRSNPEAVDQDFPRFHDTLARNTLPGAQVIGPRERLFIHPSACVEPLVVVNTTNGAVIVDQGSVVQSFSRLEGPCYIGPGSQVLGARVRQSTIGPQCRVGGEVAASIMQGFSNKHHDGFLGHSYVGEWVNLAAGTQVSDLRNDYGNVKVNVAGHMADTGQMKVGAFLGDHVRTGVGTLLNCGTVAGAFARLLPGGSYLPRAVPSFCTVWAGRLQERVRFRELFAAATIALRRRGQVWTDAHAEFFLNLYETTAGQRREVLYSTDGRRDGALILEYPRPDRSRRLDP